MAIPTPEEQARRRQLLRLRVLADVDTLPDLLACVKVLAGVAQAQARGLLFAGDQRRWRAVASALGAVAEAGER